MLKPVLLKDLRIQCRARGLSPAGGKEQLTERLRDDMIATND
jgi:SPIRAL1-like protein